VLDLRQELIGWMDSLKGASWAFVALGAAGQEGIPVPYGPGWLDAPDAKRQVLDGMPRAWELAGRYSRLLSTAHSFYITSEMTQFLLAAAHKLPAEVLHLTDLASPRGLMLLAQPMPMQIDRDPYETSFVDGVMWELQYYDDHPGTPYLHLAALAHPHPKKYEDREAYASRVPTLLMTWPLGQPWPEPATDSPSQLLLKKFLLTFLRVCWQRVPLIAEQKPDRAALRRAARAGLDLDEVATVRVVQLRRAQTRADEDSDREAEPVNWSHRWMVGAFWRQQWYPSLGQHRTILILPYIKGPPDKPLVFKDTAYSLEC
jgi:hypothetical protein